MSTTTRSKRTYEDADDHHHEQTRFDFVYSNEDKNNTENLGDLFERLALLKQQLNDVKGRLSDKDIADWNR